MDMLQLFIEDHRLLLIGLAAALVFVLFWWWNRSAEKWLNENGRDEERPTELDWLLQDVHEKSATPLKFSEQGFQEMVSRALDEVPEEFEKEWTNLVVTVSTGCPSELEKKRMGVPEGHLVFGTYSGVSRTKGLHAAASRHVIVIYQRALELRYGSDKERLEEEIRRVVLHELAHHLGMSHERMREIGL